MTNKTIDAQRSPIGGLIALNGALLLVLAAVTFGGTVMGQARGRGEYTMAAGGVTGGGDSPAVFIIDVANQEMIAMMYNPNAKQLDGLGYRNLAADAAALQPGRGRPNP